MDTFHRQPRSADDIPTRLSIIILNKLYDLALSVNQGRFNKQDLESVLNLLQENKTELKKYAEIEAAFNQVQVALTFSGLLNEVKSILDEVQLRISAFAPKNPEGEDKTIKQ